MSLTHNETKLVRSLARKSVRDAEGLFLVEGPKAVGELLGHFPCVLLAGVEAYISAHPALSAQAAEVRLVSPRDLARASLQQAPQGVLAVFRKPAPAPPTAPLAGSGLCLALDGVQDPGNVGTILRTADWFGIRRIFCSPTTADVYGPKVVQATMGALARVSVVPADLPALLDACGSAVPVYGTFLDGTNIHRAALSADGIVVMGSEGNGISAAVAQRVSHRLFIPPYPGDVPTSESLNVAVAAGIVCATFRARQHP